MSGSQPGIREHTLSELDLKTSTHNDVRVVCGYPLTDGGNALRLIALYGDDIRYCAEIGEWFIWDDSRWPRDVTLKIRELAKKTVKLIHAEASFIDEDDPKERKAAQKRLTNWAYQSDSNFRINAMIQLAQSDPRIAVMAKDFDANPWLINCQNGTLDLNARELRDPDRNDLVTKIAAVPYEPETVSSEWYERLIEVLSLEQGAFLQRACGSGLTAINRDKALFVLYGEANARKSTLLDAIFKTLVDYAAPVNISTFAKAIQKPGGARADLVSLEGVRAAQCSEVPRGMVFNDSFLKAVTSGNPQSARGLFEKRQRKIDPRTKFYIETNFLPKLDFDDDASFNRFFIVQFLNPIALEECDPKIKEFLLEDENAQKAIFAWLVQGCYDWQDYGLMPPDSVNAARKDYQKSMNPLAAFIESECIVEAGAESTSKALYERFRNVATAEERHNVSTPTSFYSYLTKLGFKSIHKESGNLRAGIRLRDIGEYDDEVAAPLKAELNAEGYEGGFDIRYMTAEGYHEKLVKMGSLPSGPQVNGEREKHEKELVEDVKQILNGFKKARSGPIDMTTNEFAAELSKTIKADKPWLRDYPVEQFYKKLAETDPEVQTLIADCSRGKHVPDDHDREAHFDGYVSERLGWLADGDYKEPRDPEYLCNFTVAMYCEENNISADDRQSRIILERRFSELVNGNGPAASIFLKLTGGKPLLLEGDESE